MDIFRASYIFFFPWLIVNQKKRLCWWILMLLEPAEEGFVSGSIVCQMRVDLAHDVNFKLSIFSVLWGNLWRIILHVAFCQLKNKLFRICYGNMFIVMFCLVVWFPFLVKCMCLWKVISKISKFVWGLTYVATIVRAVSWYIRYFA